MTPGWTVAVRLARSISRIWFICVKTTVSAPSMATAPPDSPVPAPRGTSGVEVSPAQRTIAWTSAVERGKATPERPAGTQVLGLVEAEGLGVGRVGQDAQVGQCLAQLLEQVAVAHRGSLTRHGRR